MQYAVTLTNLDGSYEMTILTEEELKEKLSDFFDNSQRLSFIINRITPEWKRRHPRIARKMEAL